MNRFCEKGARTAIGFTLMGWLIPALSCGFGASDPNEEKGASMPWLPGPDTQARQELKGGLQAAQEGRWQDAIERFKAANRRSPVWPSALFNLGWACDKAGGQTLRAAIWYRAYLAAKPDASDASAVRQRIGELIAGTEGAVIRIMGMEEEVCRAVPANYPQSTRIAYGEAWLDMDRPDKALETAKRIDQKGQASWLVEVVRKFARQGDLDLARESAQYMASIDPNDRNCSDLAFGALAEGLARAGDIQGALKIFDEITYHPDAVVLPALAEAYIAKGDLAGCGKLVDKASSDRERGLVQCPWACALAARGDTAEALDIVDMMPNSERPGRAMIMTAVVRRFCKDGHSDWSTTWNMKILWDLDGTPWSFLGREHFDAVRTFVRFLAEEFDVGSAEEVLTRYNRYYFKVDPAPWYDLARVAVRKAEADRAAQEAWKILEEAKQRVDPNGLEAAAEERFLCLRDLTQTLAEKGRASMTWTETLDWTALAATVEADTAHADLASLEASAAKDNSKYLLLPVAAGKLHIGRTRFRQTDLKWKEMWDKTKRTKP